MKKVLFIFILFLSFNVMASSGKINQDSVIKCNNKYYGYHSFPIHWHMVEKVNGTWVINGGVVSIPPCYIEPVNQTEEVTLDKCIDGDTASFKIKKEIKKVRFLAIDTMEVNSGSTESMKYGKMAKDYTCDRIKKAKTITLEYDANSDKEDKYGRVLAFVYADDELLQKSLIKKGLARVYYVYGDYKYLDELQKEEAIAKKNQIGIWGMDEKLPDTNDSKKIDELIKTLKKVYQYLKKIFTFLTK